MYESIAEVLIDSGAKIVHERVFGSLDCAEEIFKSRERVLSSNSIEHTTAVNYIEGRPVYGSGFAGVLIEAAVTDVYQVDTICHDGKPKGCSWTRGCCKHVILQDLRGPESGGVFSGSRTEQLRGMFGQAQEILHDCGGSYNDVVRTWFYVDDILDWYDDFNTVRSECYSNFGIMPRSGGQLLLPASTGIEGSSVGGHPAMLSLYAVIGSDDMKPAITQLSNAGQQDAFLYGSAFSRGAIIETNSARLMHLSGTASINEAGESLYDNDIDAQINLTLDKIRNLIAPWGAELSDMCSATVFVKRPEHFDTWLQISHQQGLEDIPAVCMTADVCRDELLFELDGKLVWSK